MNYQTIQVRVEQSVCTIRLHRPQAGNTINRRMVDECLHALAGHDGRDGAAFHIVVLEGLPDVFCLGADLGNLSDDDTPGGSDIPVAETVDPEALYALWLQLATGPCISIAHVRGKVNAGGIGFVAACDIVLAAPNAEFSLSELLFDLFPACVLPFLQRRTGFQKAHYMTLMTRPVTLEQAQQWHLVDAVENDSDALLRKHLLRLRRLSKNGVGRYKRYADELDGTLAQSRELAVAANRALFSDPASLQKIKRYQRTGLFPWEDG